MSYHEARKSGAGAAGQGAVKKNGENRGEISGEKAENMPMSRLNTDPVSYTHLVHDVGALCYII